ncbi:MAG: malto-oligosyltrehalose trehalohydrolase [Acidimicrobiales bacterium]
MHTFRVWAPDASSVEVVLAESGERLGMAREPTEPGRAGGWWAGVGRAVQAGDDYSFSIDGGEPLPDPRSASQPAGIDGPSRVVDHSAFPWTDAGWRGIHLPSAVIYEGHVGTFSPEGTFAGVAARLDHLVDLGVDAIELMPVAEFGGARGWGYDGVDLYAPHHAYGGPEGLKALVDACHARGLAVIFDVVYNHLGPAGNHLSRFGPYFTDRYATPWGQAVNLDGPGSDEVRAFLVDNARSWLRDYHGDGLRLDAVHAIVDTSATHLLEELAVAVDELAASLGRSLFVIAESDLNDPRLVRSREAGGYGLDAQWSDDFHHALFAVLTGERTGYYADFGRLGDVATALRGAYVYAGRYSAYRGRTHGRPATGLAGTRFLGYLEDHDQVGNRALGDRSSVLMSEGRVAVGLGLVLTSPFVPMLFQGEEWGTTTPFLYFTDHADPELGRAVRDGRRREFAAFGWDPSAIPDPQAVSTFAASVLDWSEPALDGKTRMLEWTRALIALRRSWPDLSDGRLDRVGVRVDEEAGWLAVERGRLAVVANLGPVPARVSVPSPAPDVLLSSTEGVEVDGSVLVLPPDSLAVARVD